MEGGRGVWRRNAALLLTLRRAYDEAQEHEQEHDGRHEAAMKETYGDADDAHTDPETARWNGDDFADSPAQWFHDARVAVCKAMREAIEGGLTHAKDLEPLREYLTVQEVLAVRAELSEDAARRPA